MGKSLYILKVSGVGDEIGDERTDVAIGHGTNVACEKQKVESPHPRIFPPLWVRVVGQRIHDR